MHRCTYSCSFTYTITKPMKSIIVWYFSKYEWLIFWYFTQSLNITYFYDTNGKCESSNFNRLKVVDTTRRQAERQTIYFMLLNFYYRGIKMMCVTNTTWFLRAYIIQNDTGNYWKPYLFADKFFEFWTDFWNDVNVNFVT